MLVVQASSLPFTISRLEACTTKYHLRSLQKLIWDNASIPADPRFDRLLLMRLCATMLATITETSITAWVTLASAIIVGISVVGGLAISRGLALARQLKEGIAALKTDVAVAQTQASANADRIDSHAGQINAIALATPTVQPAPTVKLDPIALANAMHAAMQRGTSGAHWPAPAANIPPSHGVTKP